MERCNIREYYGTHEDAGLWLLHVERMSELVGCDEQKRLNYGLAYLRGQAELWLASQTYTFTTWDAFKKALTERFRAVNFEDSLEEKLRTINQKNTENVHSYAERYRYLFKLTTNLGHINRWSKYWVKGLKGDAPKHVLMNQPGTFEGAVTLAARYEQAEAILTGEPDDEVDLLPTDTPQVAGLEEMIEQFAHLARSAVTSKLGVTRTLQPPRDHSRERYREVDTKKTHWENKKQVTLHANRASHLGTGANNTPVGAPGGSGNQGPSKTMQCVDCGQYGHAAHQCYGKDKIRGSGVSRSAVIQQGEQQVEQVQESCLPDPLEEECCLKSTMYANCMEHPTARMGTKRVKGADGTKKRYRKTLILMDPWKQHIETK